MYSYFEVIRTQKYYFINNAELIEKTKDKANMLSKLFFVIHIWNEFHVDVISRSKNNLKIYPSTLSRA